MRSLILFTRDLRVHDHPALADAARRGDVLPLFVLDPTLTRRSPNRTRFLLDALTDLDASLRRRGASLVVRHGDAADVAVAVATRYRCDAIAITSDVTSVAARRAERMRASGMEVHEYEGNEVVEPGAVSPADAPAYRLFTPYLHAWTDASRRRIVPAPRRIRSVDDVRPGRLLASRSVRGTAARSPRGGEVIARSLAQRYLRTVERYGEDRDRLDVDATSHLSPYIRFGCLSVNELAARATERGGDAFVRQLAWRDFFRQLVAAEPRRTRDDLRPERAPGWRDDAAAFEAWTRGETGVPIVDAAMRQLLRDGWMPNRARLIAASYLTRTLGLDWRLGAAHFDRLLVDGDPSSNVGNWQWVAGTGANPRRGVALNPARQAARFDPTGAYREKAGL